MSPRRSSGRQPVRRIVRALSGREETGVLAVARHGLWWRWGRIRARTRPLEAVAVTAADRAVGVVAGGYPALPDVAQAALERLDSGRRLADRARQRSLAPRLGPSSWRPDVSIVVISCDRSELLGVTLRSVQLQGVDDFECLVVDDASTDDSFLVAQAFVDADERFSLLVHERPSGVAAACGTGLAASAADWVWFIHSGDVLIDGALHEQLARVGREPGISGVRCQPDRLVPPLRLDRHGYVRASDRRPLTRTPGPERDGDAREPFESLLLRRLDVAAAGGFDDGVSAGDHRGLNDRLRERGCRIVDAHRMGVMRISDPSSEPRAVSPRPSHPNPQRHRPGTSSEDYRSPDRALARRVGRVPRVVSPDAIVDGEVVLIGEARYHIDELGPLADELSSRHVPVGFMLSPKTRPTALSELAMYADQISAFSPEAIHRAGAVVVLNDWGPVRPLIEHANERGIPTFAKVEGVQDFEDLDTGRWREPYRTAAVVLGQGANDAVALAGRPVEVIGSSRLERIWHAPPVERGDDAVVNLNFTFKVLSEHRDEWMRTVVAALASAGVDGRVSSHPAERSGEWGLAVATKPFRHEITKAGVLISRFSTVPFEAMARGVPFVYHNPHGERVPTFTEPDGAFDVTTTSADLADSVARWLGPEGDDYRATARQFFLRQVDVQPDRSSEQRAADVIVRALG